MLLTLFWIKHTASFSADTMDNPRFVRPSSFYWSGVQFDPDWNSVWLKHNPTIETSPYTARSRDKLSNLTSKETMRVCRMHSATGLIEKRSIWRKARLYGVMNPIQCSAKVLSSLGPGRLYHRVEVYCILSSLPGTEQNSITPDPESIVSRYPQRDICIYSLDR